MPVSTLQVMSLSSLQIASTTNIIENVKKLLVLPVINRTKIYYSTNMEPQPVRVFIVLFFYHHSLYRRYHLKPWPSFHHIKKQQNTLHLDGCDVVGAPFMAMAVSPDPAAGSRSSERQQMPTKRRSSSLVASLFQP